jgi:hypothetical protein
MTRAGLEWNRMKRLQPKKILKALAGEALLARVRLTKAESRLATAKEQVQITRQRRKAAKLAARRAKKRFRLLQEKTAKAKLFLAQLESQLAQLQQGSIPRVAPKTAGRKTTAASRRKTAGAIKPPRSKTGCKPARSQASGEAGALPFAAASFLPATDHMEVPVTVIPQSSSKATAHIVRQVKEIFTGEKLAKPGKQGKIAKAAKITTGAETVPPSNHPETP